MSHDIIQGKRKTFFLVLDLLQVYNLPRREAHRHEGSERDNEP